MKLFSPEHNICFVSSSQRQGMLYNYNRTAVFQYSFAITGTLRPFILSYIYICHHSQTFIGTVHLFFFPSVLIKHHPVYFCPVLSFFNTEWPWQIRKVSRYPRVSEISIVKCMPLFVFLCLALFHSPSHSIFYPLKVNPLRINIHLEGRI